MGESLAGDKINIAQNQALPEIRELLSNDETPPGIQQVKLQMRNRANCWGYHDLPEQIKDH